MAEIHPFRSYRYDSTRVSLERVLTQPYDKISPALQQQYYAASPHNLVRILLGRSQAADDSTDNVYTRAAASFKEWRRQGILLQDPQPSIYLHCQRFTHPASFEVLERRSFIALGRIEDYSRGVVFRHEQTLTRPKADRLELLRATRAHFGQLFMLYEDDGAVESAVGPSPEPLTSVTDEKGVVHELTPLCDPNLIARLQLAMQEKKLIIADGHHRYETALAYRDECRASSSGRAAGAASGQYGMAPHEFVTMTFVNLKGPGVVILPTHRVVHGLHLFSVENFCSAAGAFFKIDKIDASLDGPSAAAILEESGRREPAILAVTADRAFLLHPLVHAPVHAENSGATSDSEVFAGLSSRQRALDVVQLHKCLLEKVLHLSEESIRGQQNISYVREAKDALSRVRGGDAPGENAPGANIAFLMNPCRVEQVRDIALAGEVMPQKSTDFYPKLLSGMAIYAFD